MKQRADEKPSRPGTTARARRSLTVLSLSGIYVQRKRERERAGDLLRGEVSLSFLELARAPPAREISRSRVTVGAAEPLRRYEQVPVKSASAIANQVSAW